MSAPDPRTAADLPDDRPNHEPSMEEILASIRRIISDDQSHSSSRDVGRTETVAPSAVETEAAPPAAPKWPYANAVKEDVEPDENEPEVRSFSRSLTERRSDPPFKPMPADPRQFFSRQAEPTQTDSKLNDAADTGLRADLDSEAEIPVPRPPILRRTIEPVQAIQEDAPIASPATDAAVASSFNALFASQLLPDPETLAELTREMLRPMLKAWLDDNLPVMVERLVRAEIERVARGGR